MNFTRSDNFDLFYIKEQISYYSALNKYMSFYSQSKVKLPNVISNKSLSKDLKLLKLEYNFYLVVLFSIKDLDKYCKPWKKDISKLKSLLNEMTNKI